MIDVAVVGASGYVGAEIIRLLAQHPEMNVVAAFSRRERRDIGELHQHLAPACGGLAVRPYERIPDLLEGDRPLGVFLAVPHGESAPLAAQVATGRRPSRIVDCGADFRLEDAESFGRVYGVEHGAPGLFGSFHCGLPDLDDEAPAPHAAHPGCFTTSVCLGLAPLIRTGFLTDRIVASCVTGSSGSGATPSAATHHPARHGSVRGYGAFVHRHVHEMRRLLGRHGDVPDLVFLPHSGPFVRGIHATLSVRLAPGVSLAEIHDLHSVFYSRTPFVHVATTPPALADVRGSNDARIGIVADGRDAVIYVVIDNLVKGAAGGAVQWMNRLMGLEPSCGLTAPALAWS